MALQGGGSTWDCKGKEQAVHCGYGWTVPHLMMVLPVEKVAVMPRGLAAASQGAQQHQTLKSHTRLADTCASC